MIGIDALKERGEQWREQWKETTEDWSEAAGEMLGECFVAVFDSAIRALLFLPVLYCLVKFVKWAWTH